MLSLNEKLNLLTGEGGFSTYSVPSENLRGIRMADGSNGVKTEDGMNACIMNTGLMASSWDKDICYAMGRLLGMQAVQSGVDMLLAPAINLKRNPMTGRNFEYYSEDPVLTGNLATSFIEGVHSMGVMVCTKHFACNNQEYRRWSQNSVIDDDTMRNLYLKAFEIVVKNTDVDAIMASYNRVNGVPACENKYLLSDVLRKEWGFEGVIMSDWCAMDHCIESYKNGLDLEMPGNAHNTVAKLERAVEEGELSVEDVDRKVKRILGLSEKAQQRATSLTEEPDIDGLIRMTGESFVLLKNEQILPFDRQDKLLLIGTAKEPRIQGGGCAEMKTNVIKTPYEELSLAFSVCDCVDGYDIVGKEESLKEYDKIIVFLTLPEDCDSEAFDRKTLKFPQEQVALIKKLGLYNSNILAVLQNGSAVDLSFEGDVKGILETYYAGSYGACALRDVLCGKLNPCGKLAETFPKKESDVPNHKFFGLPNDVVYTEKEFVGYRYYKTYGIKTRFPFGYGLSYASYDLSNITISQSDTYHFDITCDITNLSDQYDGKETVQIYLKSANPFEPKMQLLDFETVRVKAKETTACHIVLNRTHFEHYVGGKKVVRIGNYTICVATSSEHILKELKVVFADEKEMVFDRNTLVGMLLTSDKYREITMKHMRRIMNYWAYQTCETENCFEDDVFLRHSIYNMPLRSFTYFEPNEFDDVKMENFLEELRKIV